MLIRCLGPVALQHEDGGETRLSAANRHILALLVAAGPDGLSTDKLADEIYGDDLTPGWEAAVRKNISRLRPALGLNKIVNRNSRYMLAMTAEQVDLWTLLAIEDLDIADLSEDLIQALLSGEAFGGVEPSPLLIGTQDAIAVARLQLVQKMSLRGRNEWSAKTLLETRALASRSYYEPDLLTAVLDLHLSSAKAGNIAEFATKARRYLVEEMVIAPGAQLQALIDAATTQSLDAPEQTQNIEPLAGRVLGLFEPASTAGMINRPVVGNAIRTLLEDRSGVLVTGDSGSGKSALTQAMVPELVQSGHHLLWLTGRRGATTAYQPFLTAVPSLEQDLAPLLDDGGNDLLRTRCWIAARARLATEFIDLPLVLVLDDAQWLDSHSQALVIFLASTQDAASPTLVVIGRDDPSARDWDRFAGDLLGLGLTTVDVGAFDQHQLLELIGLHHQAATSKQRHDFATALLRRRAALPAVAHQLVRTADPSTLTIGDLRSSGETTGVWVPLVRPPTQQIAATAAVLGMRFRLSAIADLTGLDIGTIADASDELRDASIWVSEQRPDEFSFRHVLIHADFDGVLPAGDRRRLHLQAGQAAEAQDDLHASATHLVEAGALVGNEHVVDALLASARQFQTQGSYREAVEAFSHAHRIADQELGIDDLLGFASAVASSGGDGWDLRSAAFELALAADSAPRCLEIALHGALRVEDIMGQPRRVKMLERIDATGLSEELRAEHAAALARELGILGSHDRALETVAAAMAQTSTPDDHFTAWLGAWASYRSLPPDSWPPLPRDRGMVTRPELVSRLAQIECALALVVGDDAAARRHLRSFAHHPVTQSDPLRSWHASLVEITLSFVDGRWDDSRRQADLAFAAAAEQGVVAAFSTRIAQEFVLQWVVEQHGALLPQFESAPPDIRESVLARAAFAITLAQHPSRHDIAKTTIAEVAAQAQEHQSPLSPAAAALLASAPAEMLTADTTATLRSVLTPFLGSTVIPGAAVTHLGPASRPLAQLASSHDERVVLLRQAADEAKAWNLRLWSVVCLRDLATLTSDETVAAEARQLAAGTQLEMLL